jgi:hypothetical protein
VSGFDVVDVALAAAVGGLVLALLAVTAWFVVRVRRGALHDDPGAAQ